MSIPQNPLTDQMQSQCFKKKGPICKNVIMKAGRK